MPTKKQKKNKKQESDNTMRFDASSQTKKIRVVGFDLDGTLSNHKQPLPLANRATLAALAKRYRLVMVGAGTVTRIFDQMEHFPLDVIGNYGMQESHWDAARGELCPVRDETVPVDRESVEKRVTLLREKYGFTTFAGDNTEFHPSGCVTFPILGTRAQLPDKLAFDPDRSRRRAIYADVAAAFPEYTVFVGGSSSFDMAPAPFNKYYAFDRYLREHGVAHGEAVFVGDDYGVGGNDESVFLSDIPFITVDDYRDFPAAVASLLQ